MAKGKGGFIGQDGLNAPDSPTSVSASGGDTQATVSFTAPSDVGGSAITGYVATSNDGIGATGTASPVTVTGLTNGTSYTFNVWAINAFGWSVASDATDGVTPLLARAVFGGGYISGGWNNVIEYVEISTTSNGTDFGDLIESKGALAAYSSTTRGIFAGGQTASGETVAIDYITIQSTGNASDFGDISRTNTGYIYGASNSTRGLSFGGNDRNNIDYVTIATTGNTSDFGDMSQNSYSGTAAASPTRAICHVTNNGGANDTLEYVTIASTGNTTDFGDAADPIKLSAACSSDVRMVRGGGQNSSGTKLSSMWYVTIASTGNETSFGQLSNAVQSPFSTSSNTRGLFAGGDHNTLGRLNNIDYVTIASAGNATDFGDLTAAKENAGACSSAHGGLS